MTKPNMTDVLIAINHVLPKDGPIRVEQTKKRSGPQMEMAFAAMDLKHKVKLQNPDWEPMTPSEMAFSTMDIQVKRLGNPGNRYDPQPGIVAGNGYPLNKMRLDGGHLRMVTAKRARTLKKRGVYVRWSGNLGWYTWRME